MLRSLEVLAMIEAILLVAVLLAMLLLLLHIKRASKPGATQTTGLLAYLEVKAEVAGPKKPKAKVHA